MKGKKILGAALAAVILLFLFRQLYTNWEAVQGYEWRFDYSYLSISMTLLVIFFLFTAYLWRMILKDIFKKNLTQCNTIHIWIYSHIARYIPGNVGSVFTRMFLAKKCKIPKRITFVSTIVELVFELVAAFLLFIFVALIFSTNINLHFDSLFKGLTVLFFIAAIFLLLMGIIFFVHPSTFTHLVNFALKRLKKPPINFKFSPKTSLKLFTFYFLMQILEGLSFAFFLFSIYSTKITLSNLLLLTAFYEGAWVIGFLSFLTPSGLGVREGVLVILLAPIIPVGVTILAALLWRFAGVIIEVLIAGAVYLYITMKRES